MPLGFSRIVGFFGNKPNGSSASQAAESAQQLKIDHPNTTDGAYWINLPNVGPTLTYCLMDSGHDGGGWMMAMKATRGYTFSYGDSYWTQNNTLNTTATNRNDGDAKFEVFNNYSALQLLAIFPDIGQGGSYSYGGDWVWLQKNIYGSNNQTQTTLLNLFQTANEVFLGDAKQFSGYGSPWSSQRDVRFYGYNYTGGHGAATRWGFGWNENGGGLYPNGNMSSDDVSGGIGMNDSFGRGYSAGDYIRCCQDSTGINRSARVEIYVR